MRLLLLRHARTAWNADGRMQGSSDVDLDDAGRAQAALAGSAIADLAGASPVTVISSDLRRARVTAAAVALAVGVGVDAVVEVDLDPRLRERDFGPWEGLTLPEIEAGWPEPFAAWRRGEEPGLGVETRAAVADRMAAACAHAVQEAPADGLLVLVSHGGSLATLAGALLAADAGSWFGIRAVGNGHWSLLESNPRMPPDWRLVAHDAGPI